MEGRQEPAPPQQDVRAGGAFHIRQNGRFLVAAWSMWKFNGFYYTIGDKTTTAATRIQLYRAKVLLPCDNAFVSRWAFWCVAAFFEQEISYYCHLYVWCKYIFLCLWWRYVWYMSVFLVLIVWVFWWAIFNVIFVILYPLDLPRWICGILLPCRPHPRVPVARLPGRG